MSNHRRFRLYSVFLAVCAATTIWIVGSGEATPNSEVFWAQSDNGAAGTDRGNRRVGRETLYKYAKLLSEISFKVQSHYMDTINTKEMIYAGIRGMLDVLDPFSVLMEQRRYDRLMESTHGKYEGLGMQIDLREDTITIIAPIEGTPAERVGLQAGDRIVKIKDESTAGMTTADAAKLMRGPAGTEIVITIKRAGLPEPLDYTVERAVIELKSVPYYGITDEENKIGYLRLNKFSETSDQELRDAIQDLNKQGVRSLIFDLRSNGGGLLDQAVKTADLFLQEDRLVVYTQGRDPGSQRKYFSSDKPLLGKDVPVIVLVDGGTASASEIVSGALQDWDRGLILGNTTFGKGLVQQIFRLPEAQDVALKLTTARYYVPSGRSIQKPSRSTKHPREEAEDDDSEIVEKDEEIFYTDKGREVYGGGGIVPDVRIDRPQWNPLEINLWRQGKFFNYAVHYAAGHEDIGIDFEAGDDVVTDFLGFLEEQNFEFKTRTEVELNKMVEALEEDPERLAIYQSAINEMRSLVEKEKELAFEESEPTIRRELSRAILNKVYGQRGYYEGSVFHSDVYVKKAIEILSDPDEYERLLSIGNKS